MPSAFSESFFPLILLIIVQVQAQFDSPNGYAKPTVTPDLAKYFELDGHARQLVDTLIGPRPGGFFPEKTYEIATPPRTYTSGKEGEQSGPQPPDGLASIGRAVEQSVNAEEKSKGDGPRLSPKSSISGIPNDYPKLPKFPMAALGEQMRRQEQQPPVVMKNAPEVPKFASKPEVPEGGLGPAAEVRRHPASVSEAVLSSSAADASEYGTLTDESHVPGGLIGTVLDLFGFNKEGKPSDANGIGKAVTNLLGGSNSPLPGKSMISNVLYKALTSGSIQDNATDTSGSSLNTSTPITLTAAQQAAIGENLEMIQGLISQPSSPFCNPKPVPVSEFNLDAFMGQWYQVVYSPPLTQSACSVVSYKKLADVNNGGIGSIFEIFEYTTDGTPYSKPKITSGYAILKQAGELILRTTAHQEDVNVHVIFTGPINTNGEYDFTIMTTNCNYPLYVFARDPIVYKQRYETAVNQILEQKGIVNGFSKLLNIIAPVDASTCTFPPTLFNFKG
ncbi:hypothetical protein Ddc_00765 [Ditylenchus destructor]|nr:hypothetical protein Ddc_00765 [Ditylenchus destructor]